MGKYIKYFKTAEEFADYYNFGDWAEGPDGSDTTLVAYVAENDTVYYNNSDMSEFDIIFGVESSEIDATAETVTFQIKTGLYHLQVYHNGELVSSYRPGEDTSDAFSVDANESPLTVTENFVGKWYKDDNGDKGDLITEWSVPVTHLPDPNADPVKLTCVLSITSDGQNPSRLGNGSITGATRVYYVDNDTQVDILNDIYVQNKRAWYQFSAQGEYNVSFEFESENQVVGDYFIYSQGTSLGIFTNYPELAEQTGFRFQGPLMNASIEELTIGAGLLSMSAYVGDTNLRYIYFEDSNRLPVVNGTTLFGVAAEGVVEAQSRDVENFELWEINLPSGWTMLPEPTPVSGSVGKVTLVINIDTSDNPYPIVGGSNVESEFSGAMELYDPNGNSVSSDDFGLYVDKEDHTRLEVQNAVDGDYTLVLRRVSDDLLIQEWLSGGEFKSFTYEEESFDGGTHISLYDSALANCLNLETVVLGTGFTRAFNTTFSGCVNLTEISTYGSAPDVTGGSPFVTIPSNTGEYHIPSGTSSVHFEDALGQNWTVIDDL